MAKHFKNTLVSIEKAGARDLRQWPPEKRMTHWHIRIQNHGRCPECDALGHMRRDIWQGVPWWVCGNCKKEWTDEQIEGIFPMPKVV